MAEQTFCFANHFRLNAEPGGLITTFHQCVLITLFWQSVSSKNTMTRHFVRDAGDRNIVCSSIICPTNFSFKAE